MASRNLPSSEVELLTVLPHWKMNRTRTGKVQREQTLRKEGKIVLIMSIFLLFVDVSPAPGMRTATC